MLVYLDFQPEMAKRLIDGFSPRKIKAEASLYIGPLAAAKESKYGNVHMSLKKRKRCKWHHKQQNREETMIVIFAAYTYVKMDAILPTTIFIFKQQH